MPCYPKTKVRINLGILTKKKKNIFKGILQFKIKPENLSSRMKRQEYFPSIQTKERVLVYRRDLRVKLPFFLSLLFRRDLLV